MRLYGEPGWGSAIIEAQLDWYGLDYEFVKVGDLFRDPEAQARVSGLNPVVQVPTLEMPDKSVLTESAAITLLLSEMTGDDSLVPMPGSDARAAFLRWLVFIVANVYPTYTYADHPPRFVESEEAQQAFRKAVDEYAIKLYGILEENAGGKWFLGERFSALDIYICVMSRWRPGREWFAETAPNLSAAIAATESIDKLKPVWERNVLGQ